VPQKREKNKSAREKRRGSTKTTKRFFIFFRFEQELSAFTGILHPSFTSSTTPVKPLLANSGLSEQGK